MREKERGREREIERERIDGLDKQKQTESQNHIIEKEHE